MQALKQAAREDNQVGIDALCAAWQLEVDGSADTGRGGNATISVDDSVETAAVLTVAPLRLSSATQASEPASNSVSESVGESVTGAGVETHR
jgi:hypothetical protein